MAAISAAASGWANWRAAAAHARQAVAVAEQGGDFSGESVGREFRLRQEQSRCASVCKGLGIVALMVVGGGGQWNENGGLSGGCDFGDGAGSGAANQQVGAREGSGHVVDEGRHFGGDSSARGCGFSGFVVLLAGLMNEVHVGTAARVREALA